MSSKGNVLIIAVVLAVLLFFGYFAVAKYIFPSVFSKAFNTGINVVTQQLKTMDFSNAKSIPVKQNFNTPNANVVLGLNKSILTINGLSTGQTISGEIQYLGETPTVNYSVPNNAETLTIQSADQEGEKVVIHLSPDLTTNIEAGIGAGLVEIDLTGLNVPSFNVGAGAGEVNITLSGSYSTRANIAAGAGLINVFIPKNVGLRVEFSQESFSNINLGPEFEKTDTGLKTKNYNTATVKADISIGQAAGGFNIKILD